MKFRNLATLIACFLVFAVASAQGYSIRANRGLNLRATPSVNADIAGTVSSGAILEVVGESGSWLQIKWPGSGVWLANWVNFSRLDNITETSSQPASNTASQVDNCCFVDRQCTTDQEWMNGYWAYQNGQCARQTTSQPMSPVSSETSAIDNCCFAGWVCRTDQEWINGFHAYHHGQCEASPVLQHGTSNSCCQLGWNCTNALDQWLGEKVVNEGFECGMPVERAYGRTVLAGSETFIAQTIAALEYLKSTVPHWYAYIVNGVSKIRGGPFGPGTFALADAVNIAPTHASEGAVVLAGTLLHEACHVNRHNDGSDRTTGPYLTMEGFSIEENICETLREGALTEANPSRPPNPWLADAIAFFRSHGGQYDFQAAANGQRDRAFWLLSQGI